MELKLSSPYKETISCAIYSYFGNLVSVPYSSPVSGVQGYPHWLLVRKWRSGSPYARLCTQKTQYLLVKEYTLIDTRIPNMTQRIFLM